MVGEDLLAGVAHREVDELLALFRVGGPAQERDGGEADPVVGERGVRLSGGQRQRLGIARALYDRPRLLVLDEATSALDSITEAKITSTLRSLRGQLTILTIAHRLSTVREADRLVLMEGGRIADQGPFDVLRSRNESFRQLVDLAQLE